MIDVLVIDDEPIIARGIAKKISSLSEDEINQVDFSFSSVQALQKCKEHSYTLVFTDINMPEINGLELVAKLLETNPQMQIIVVTGFGSLKYAQQAMELGIRHFLEKPVQTDVLQRALNETLEIISKNKLKERLHLSNSIEKMISDKNFVFQHSLFELSPTLIMFDYSHEKNLIPPLLTSLDPDILASGHIQGTNYFLIALSPNQIKHIRIKFPKMQAIIFMAQIEKASDLFAYFQIGKTLLEKEFYFDDVQFLSNFSEQKQLASESSSNYEEFKNQLLSSILLMDFHQAETDIEKFLDNCKLQLNSIYRLKVQINDLILQLIDTYRVPKDTILEEVSALIFLTKRINDLNFLLHYCLNKIKQKINPQESTNIPATLNYIIENYYGNSELSLKWISKNIFYLNPEYLGRKYFQITGQKFNNRLLNYRIDQAKKLLFEGKSVSEVAELVGYKNNPEYFFQVFKKIEGLTPHRFLISILKTQSDY
ncbi:response regulator transcription factor [Enterococcus timonensis]|uniref:response regulator transcription factor n=1 Tax=Enterococcus timonensis TaxID=1852364 RepID=UPI0008D8DFC8|nr:response regulator [Enterococcus timonensis]